MSTKRPSQDAKKLRQEKDANLATGAETPPDQARAITEAVNRMGEQVRGELGLIRSQLNRGKLEEVNPEKLSERAFQKFSAKAFEALFAVILGMSLTRVVETVAPLLNRTFRLEDMTWTRILLGIVPSLERGFVFAFLISSIVSSFFVIILHIQYNYVYKHDLASRRELLLDLLAFLLEAFLLYAMSDCASKNYSISKISTLFMAYTIIDLIWVWDYQRRLKHTEEWIRMDLFAIAALLLLFFLADTLGSSWFAILVSSVGILRAGWDYKATLKHLVDR